LYKLTHNTCSGSAFLPSYFALEAAVDITRLLPPPAASWVRESKQGGKLQFFVRRLQISKREDYTLCPIKSGAPSTIDNFVNYFQRIFKIFSPADSLKNLRKTCYLKSHHITNVSLHYLVKHECC